jgi:hypothetical protein
MPDAMKKYAANTSILVSKRMLDGGIPCRQRFFHCIWHLLPDVARGFDGIYKLRGLTKCHSSLTY